MLAGTPSIVLALFGTLLFEARPLASSARRPAAIVLRPLVLRRRRDAVARRAAARRLHRARGLQAIPSHVREASYAVGKTKIATTRRVLLPAARPSVITGAMLGSDG